MESTEPNRVLITGVSGFIGCQLAKTLLDRGTEVWGITRTPDKAQKRLRGVKLVSEFDGVPRDLHFTSVVNLAGEPILDRRWSESRKALLMSSRMDTTEKLIRWLRQQDLPPQVMISGSAIGYYGSQPDDRVLREYDSGRSGFTHHLCQRWEELALQAEDSGCRVCLIRTGVVLGRGGALSRMLPPFKLGMGGTIGHGRQWFSWISLADEVRAILFLLDHATLTGPFNLTAPEPVTNREFTQTLGKVLHRPTLLPLPAWTMRLALGEGASLLTEGQRVVPAKLMEAGFTFKHPGLEDALKYAIA